MDHGSYGFFSYSVIFYPWSYISFTFTNLTSEGYGAEPVRGLYCLLLLQTWNCFFPLVKKNQYSNMSHMFPDCGHVCVTPPSDNDHSFSAGWLGKVKVRLNQPVGNIQWKQVESPHFPRTLFLRRDLCEGGSPYLDRRRHCGLRSYICWYHPPVPKLLTLNLVDSVVKQNCTTWFSY